jgi:hypothetical protein
MSSTHTHTHASVFSLVQQALASKDSMLDEHRHTSLQQMERIAELEVRRVGGRGVRWWMGEMEGWRADRKGV